MNTPSTYEKFHWALFNFLAKKMMGGGFIFVSVILLIATFLDQNGEWYGKDEKIIIYLISPVMALLGSLLLKSKPYYPKQYHEYYEQIGKIK